MPEKYTADWYRANAAACSPGSTLRREYLIQACAIDPGHDWTDGSPGWITCRLCTTVRKRDALVWSLHRDGARWAEALRGGRAMTEKRYAQTYRTPSVYPVGINERHRGVPWTCGDLPGYRNVSIYPVLTAHMHPSERNGINRYQPGAADPLPRLARHATVLCEQDYMAGNICSLPLGHDGPHA